MGFAPSYGWWRSRTSFGQKYAISGDTVLVVGRDDVYNGIKSDSLYVFACNGAELCRWSRLWPVMEHQETFLPKHCHQHWLSSGGNYSNFVCGNSRDLTYVFASNGTERVQMARIVANAGAAGDYFGICVAISGDTLVVGAYSDDDSGNFSGSTFVFPTLALDEYLAKLVANTGAAEHGFGLCFHQRWHYSDGN